MLYLTTPNCSPSIDGDAPSPLLHQPTASSSTSPSTRLRSLPVQTSPSTSTNPSRFQRQRPAVTPSAFDRGGRARVQALARAAAAAGIGDEVKTLRPATTGDAAKRGTPGKSTRQQQQQQPKSGRWFSPSKLQKGPTQVKDNFKMNAQSQPQQKQQQQQQQQHAVRGPQLHDFESVASPREESGSEDVRHVTLLIMMMLSLCSLTLGPRTWRCCCPQ
jgi:hypothetical protein